MDSMRVANTGSNVLYYPAWTLNFELASAAPRRMGTAVQNSSDADRVYYLNRTTFAVIGTQS